MNEPFLLIVDDEPEMGAYVSFAAESASFEVAVTDSAQAFQQAYLKREPDLIVMDVAMPDIDAVGLFDWLRDAGNQTPVILMSGYGDHMLSWASTLGKDMGIPVVETLTKPISLEELETILMDYSPIKPD